jgi:hypothetical protein
MARTTVTGREWLEFEEWACEELNLFDFRAKFMTDAEKAESLGPREVSGPLMVVRDGKLERLDAPSTPEPEMSDEEWKQMLNDITAEETRDQAELVALAERLGCGIYLAAYLRHLNRKLEIIADAHHRARTQELPKRVRRRK